VILLETWEEEMSTYETAPAGPTQDERILAGLAHVSAILPLVGVIAPIVIWVTQKDRSRLVGFQALQALVYQLTMVVAWFVGMACYMCSFIGTFAGIAGGTLSGPVDSELSGLRAALTILPMVLPFLVLGLMFLGGIAFVVYGVVGAVQSLRGRAFRYAIIGARLERYLEERPPAAAEAGTRASDVHRGPEG
jgi:uncharacterized Tic20 family protein